MSQKDQMSAAPSKNNPHFWRWRTVVAAVGLVALGLMFRWARPPQEPPPVFIPFSEAQSVVKAHYDAPRELLRLSSGELAKFWPTWVAHQDAQVRRRVAQGEEDTLANLLLYGTSFTREPRITDAYRSALIRQLGSADAADRALKTVITARARDLARALAEPGEDERRLTMLEIASRTGPVPRTQEEQAQLAQYLFDNLVRFLNEHRAYAAEMAAVKQTNAAAAFANLAILYQKRGLSTDTSILVDYALAQALREVKSGGLLPPSSVRRAGVVGPGLDLIDKQGGYDLYPPQTTQPLVLLDTLLRLELANADDLQVTTFDISTRVNHHIERAVKKAHQAQAYPVHLVLDEAWDWSPGAIHFWRTSGDRIGAVVDAAPAVALNGVFTRSIQIRPEWVARIHPVDLNIVYQQLPLSKSERFDLLIATNILCYYNLFEQRLALRNAARMLRPGGILLSTEVLPESPNSDMQRVGATPVRTSKSDNFSIYWYRRR